MQSWLKKPATRRTGLLRSVMRVAAPVALLAWAATGCADADADAGGSAPPQEGHSPLEGVYRFMLTEQHLREEGISPQQAAMDAGTTTAVIYDGHYAERWHSRILGDTACVGTYRWSGMRLTVTYGRKSGCDGAWSMTGTLTGDTLTWAQIEATDPGASDQGYVPNYNVPWTRVGDAGDAAELSR